MALTHRNPSPIPQRNKEVLLPELHEAYCVLGLERREFTHDEYWSIVLPMLEGSGFELREIGRSAEGRPLRAITWGSGPTRVLAWTQMHGDEPSYTLAFADLICFLAREPDDLQVSRLAGSLTLTLVPMLNPDGAERFDRLNAQGLDLNRDARAWVTPELSALRELFHAEEPEWCLNLHNQNTRTRSGISERLTALALLSEPVNDAGEDTAQTIRAKRLAGCVARAAKPIVGDHIARYPAEYDGASFGEYTQRAGSSTLLMEAGFWPHDPQKQFLRGLAFATLIAALDAIAAGDWQSMPLEAYESLPENDPDVFDVLIRGGIMVAPGLEPYRADVGINFEVPLDLKGGTVADLGDLREYAGRVVVEADGLFIHPGRKALRRQKGARATLHPEQVADFVIRAGPSRRSRAVYRVVGGVVERLDRSTRKRPLAAKEPS